MEVMGEFIGRIGPSDNPFVLPSGSPRFQCNK